MNPILNNFLNAVKAMLPESHPVTPEEIGEQVDFILSSSRFKDQDIDRDLMIRELKGQYEMVMDSFRIIELDDPARRVPWISPLKLDRERWKFWNRYRNYIMYKKGFAPKIVEELDELTDKILDNLYDPSVNNITISKKGLVVGQVQSGKTSNYTGLICKAIDAGYNLIIVLAGTLNNLRSQTQLRIDEGVLGFDTQSQRGYNGGKHLIGVGIPKNTLPIHSLTDSADKGDFTAIGANISFNTSDPIIAVIKKHSGVLKKLYAWLHNRSQLEGEGSERKIFSKSLLLIDDEADNASINTHKNPEEERTAINAGIRDIIGLFAKSGYVGYTATPFANVFIPVTEDTDLFPSDFIINIPPPPTYIGPEKIFGFDYYDDENNIPDTVLPICFRIDSNPKDAEALNEWTPGKSEYNKAIPPSSLPPHLDRAIQCFIITCAIRKLRGQAKAHNSMLIHIARLVKWQTKIKCMIKEKFKNYRDGITNNDIITFSKLRATFEEDSDNYLSYKSVTERIKSSPLSDIDSSMQVHTWEEIKPFLREAVVNTVVREINGGSKETLDYYDNSTNGISVIAIGGDKLSRGLTLEGLTVSYYLRASKMYDTLMQMGRWFGYRNGYTDLCRLFTTGELNEWFCHITRSTQDLREEFDYMSDVAGASPRKFTLKVRSHPGLLQITASNKIRTGVPLLISWAGRLVESYELIKDEQLNRINLNAVAELVTQIDLVSDPELKGGNTPVWYDVAPASIISWLEQIKIYKNLKSYSPENLIRFINSQVSRGALTKWRVALMSKKNVEPRASTLVGKYSIGNFIRNEATDNQETGKFFIRKSHIIDKKHESIDLDKEQLEKARRKTIELWEKNRNGKQPEFASGQVIRNFYRKKENPLLMIYLIDANESTTESKEKLDWTVPLVGYAISFPGDPNSVPVEFTANRTLIDYYDQEENTMDFNNDED